MFSFSRKEVLGTAHVRRVSEMALSPLKPVLLTFRYNCCSQPGVVVASWSPGEIWQFLETFLFVDLEMGDGATGIERVEAKDAADHPTMHGDSPHSKE